METDPIAREADCRVVYCGPPGGGKTTNLRSLFGGLDPETRGTLVSPGPNADRPFRFDFLAVDLGPILGYRTRLHLYALPADDAGNSGRSRILRGADGIVVVLDSSAARLEENRKALSRLEEDLEEAGLGPDDLVLALQYNKRDADDALPVEELEEALNPTGLIALEAVATDGRGVIETLEEVSVRVVRGLEGAD